LIMKYMVTDLNVLPKGFIPFLLEPGAAINAAFNSVLRLMYNNVDKKVLTNICPVKVINFA
jgi:hypothetical protein